MKMKKLKKRKECQIYLNKYLKNNIRKSNGPDQFNKKREWKKIKNLKKLKRNQRKNIQKN